MNCMIKPTIGSVIQGDLWTTPERLVESDWNEIEFYSTVSNNPPTEFFACNVEVTGRTVQKNKYFDSCVRILISIPSYGEKKGYSFGGWMKIPN